VPKAWDFGLSRPNYTRQEGGLTHHVAVSNNAFQIRTSLRLPGSRYRIGGAGVISEEEPR
jgi:hypothetical protein